MRAGTGLGPIFHHGQATTQEEKLAEEEVRGVPVTVRGGRCKEASEPMVSSPPSPGRGKSQMDAGGKPPRRPLSAASWGKGSRAWKANKGNEGKYLEEEIESVSCESEGLCVLQLCVQQRLQ